MADSEVMEFTNEGLEDAGGFIDGLVPEVVADLSEGALISRQHVEDEIDLMLRAVREFWSLEPDQVMRACSALSARSSELYVHLHRIEGRREWKQIRTMQVDTLLKELDRQFKIHSRIVEVRRQDLDLLRGASS